MERSPVRRSPRNQTTLPQKMSQQPSGSSSAGTKVDSQQLAPSAAGASASSNIAGILSKQKTSATGGSSMPAGLTAAENALKKNPAPPSAGVPKSSTAAGTTSAIATTTTATTTTTASVNSMTHDLPTVSNINTLPPLASSTAATSAQLESLQNQIDVLQAQLVNAQRALQAALCNNFSTASGSSAAMPQPSNITPPASCISEVENQSALVDGNSASANFASANSASANSASTNSASAHSASANSASANSASANSASAAVNAITDAANANYAAAVTSSAAANANFTERHNQTPFSGASYTDANNFYDFYTRQPPFSNMMPPNIQNLVENGGSMPMHRKIYDLPDFNGAPEDWPMFSTAFNHSTAMYKYNNFENCLRLQKALKGEARNSVKSLLIHPNNVNIVMEQLNFQYGRPEMLIRCQLQRVKEISAIGENSIDKLIPFAVTVQNLTAFLETVNGQQHLANPTLMEELVGKLPMSKRMEWARYASTIKPYATVLDFNNWLKGVADLVRIVQSTSVPQNSEPKRKVVLHADDGQRKQQECPVCQAGHGIFECKKFISMTVPNRWDEVKKLRLCFACLAVGHSSRLCRRRKQCPFEGCQWKHNKLLHETKETSEDTTPTNSANNNESVLNCVSSDADKGVMLFRVVPIVLYGPNNQIETYAILDDGSSVTMVDSSLVRQLGLQGHQSKLNLHWYAGSGAQETASVVNMHVSGVGKQRKYALRNVYGVAHLKLPTQSFNMDLTGHRGLPIKLYNNVVPKVLIGLDHCHLGLPDEIVPLEQNGPYAANTPLGWVVFGPMKGSSSPSSCLLTVQPENNLYDLVANYFETENFGVKVLPVIESQDDVRAREILKDIKMLNGRFQTRLLWRCEDVVLPDSYSMAFNRLQGIERKMKNNPEFGAVYKNIIKDYVSKRYVRKLSPNEASVISPRTWYLPHFGVVNPNKPGKIRLVFDAAASVEGVSLNSNLLKGPQQYKPLPSVLFNFRVGAVAVCGDIKEMFHQILVAPEDRCSQRFLWRDNESQKPDVYEMLVMTFGAACSPCVAQHVKENNALQFRDEYPRAVKSIVDHHYVDDFVDSFPTSSRAIEIAKQVRDIHKSAGFELRNFSSNSLEVVVALKGNADQPVNFSSDVSELQSEKVLGMYWQPNDDTFRFNLKFHNVKADVIEGRRYPTKRELLSVVMYIFDPLGFLSNYMVTAKLLMREVWRYDIRWDEVLPDEISEIWNNWRHDLKNVVNVNVPRYYFGDAAAHRLELHVFVDASEDAFGAVAYWRSISSDGKINLSFVSSKTKCAPLKPMTIPRLELQAAVLGTRLMSTILKEHSLKISRFICWSDSSTVISWIGSESRKYKPFVAHRITEILDSTSPTDWRWLPTHLNIADETTRMKTNVDFSNDFRWFKGPEFLHEEEDKWPNLISVSACDSNEELRPKFTLFINTTSIFEYERFSSFLKLKRTVAWVFRFINRCQKKSMPRVENGLTVAELKNAEEFLCRQSQKDSFCSEIEIIKNGGNLQKGSELYTLSPYIDENSLLRVYGRVDAASWLPFDARRPIILPPCHPVTELFVAYIHKKMKHQNFEATICEIRRSFWIPRLRRILRKCISNCYVCKFRSAMPVPPLMGSLPEDRLTPYIRPFSYTGLDYFGPVTITIGRRHEKRWVALFTCLTIRAIHLEVAFDLSTDACILAIRNFINRRGTPTKLRSDNGKNFIGADQVSKQFDEVFDVARIQDELSTKGIDWQFNCPYNPSEGGAWERMVQCVKRVLQSTLKESSPREHTLQSFLIEAENIVNSRPLTHLPISHEDEEPLTPNHFLLGAANTSQTPAGAISDKPPVLRKQWRISRQLRDHFWNRWINEYLPTLTRRSKWCQLTKPIAIGDLVLICDPAVSRRDWKRGRVEKVYPGSDGVIRRADIRTSTGVLKRPVSRLAVLDLM